MTTALAILLMLALCGPIYLYALRTRSAYPAIIASAVMLAGLAILAFRGAEAVAPALPLTERVAELRAKPPQALTLKETRILLQARVREAPDDAVGWGFLGDILAAEDRRFEAAAAKREAWRRAPTPERAVAYADRLMVLNDGEIGSEARALYEGVIDDESAPETLRWSARWSLGEAAYRTGNRDDAVRHWGALLADIPSGSPAREQVELDAVELLGIPERGPDTGAGAPPPMMDPAAMVANLEARVEAEPSRLSPWLQLARARGVLGEADAIPAILERAAASVTGPEARRLLSAAERVYLPVNLPAETEESP